MAQLRRNPNSSVGVSPTAAQKLIHVSNAVGNGSIKNMQGSTVNIFDTVALVTGAGRQTLNFFNNTSSKSKTWSNFQQGKLPQGASLMMQKVSFIYILATTAAFDDANVMIAQTPISGVAAALQPINMGQLGISIANSQVVSNYLIYESNPAWNPNTTGIAAASATPMGQNSIPLEAAPVLPENQGLLVTLDIPALTAPAFAFVMCVIGRFGSLYSSKVNL